MIELIHTNTLEFGDYKTEFYTEKELKEFLIKESIPCLSCRFKNPEDFYENILSKIPDFNKHKKFKMIYINKNTKLEYSPENVLATGNLTIMDTQNEEPPIIKWIILKQ